MATRRPRLAFSLAGFVLVSAVMVLAQGGPLTVGPLTVMVPPGLGRADQHGAGAAFLA